jgi:hypothetical protein
MDAPKSFSEIWKEAHRERSEYVWSIICRMMASPRRKVPQSQLHPNVDRAQAIAEVDVAMPATMP